MVAMVSDSDTEWEEEIVNKPITQEKGSVSIWLILIDTKYLWVSRLVYIITGIITFAGIL